MEKEFVFYELVVKLKALGFDEPCMGVYYGDEDDIQFVLDVRETQYYAQKGYKDGVLAPTFSQAFRWFREKYGYWCYIKEATKGTCRFYIEKFDEKFFNSDIIYSYEQSEISCLEKLIEIVETKSE
jgi:hypothetical protein